MADSKYPTTVQDRKGNLDLKSALSLIPSGLTFSRVGTARHTEDTPAPLGNVQAYFARADAYYRTQFQGAENLEATLKCPPLAGLCVELLSCSSSADEARTMLNFARKHEDDPQERELMLQTAENYLWTAVERLDRLAIDLHHRLGNLLCEEAV
ncbi:MAG: hypothetical protein RDU24_10430 [Humidesulfovibrio sp.]|uniref:hypothetical protein n=1 Tax=Humidesulfovibrio sp. TaxID=2910988 RepID=UPI0027EF7EBA|nr:hypothetical protein [Humidesulfovibrio sp.]MDQ7835785.1 hypothetical protein [Humidesulfovibrio sp.]